MLFITLVVCVRNLYHSVRYCLLIIKIKLRTRFLTNLQTFYPYTFSLPANCMCRFKPCFYVHISCMAICYLHPPDQILDFVSIGIADIILLIHNISWFQKSGFMTPKFRPHQFSLDVFTHNSTTNFHHFLTIVNTHTFTPTFRISYIGLFILLCGHTPHLSTYPSHFHLNIWLIVLVGCMHIKGNKTITHLT